MAGMLGLDQNISATRSALGTVRAHACEYARRAIDGARRSPERGDIWLDGRGSKYWVRRDAAGWPYYARLAGRVLSGISRVSRAAN
jgi:hypothetical protein